VQQVFDAMAGRGSRPEAIRALRELLPRLPPADWVVKVWAMNWFTRLDSLDDAFAAAERLRGEFARQSPTNAWSWLWSTDLHAFRMDPRFSDFTARLGMHEYWRKYGPPDDCDLAGGKLVCR
jgi:hypothetical protein